MPIVVDVNFAYAIAEYLNNRIIHTDRCMVSGWSLISRHFNDCRRLGIRKTKQKKLNMARRRWCTSLTATFVLCCTLIAHHDELVKVVGATAITTASTASDLPNVVLIVTDDQDVVLNGMVSRYLCKGTHLLTKI